MEWKAAELTTVDYKVPVVTDVICILGRGIERVSTNWGNVWRPTRYIELPSDAGGHTGFRAPNIDPNDEESLIAGSNANVLAACQLVDEMMRAGVLPALMIFAAGRPPYLSNERDATLTEGKVLVERFLRKMESSCRSVRIEILAKNRTTRDDINEALRLTVQNNAAHLTILSSEVHLPRAREFLKVAVNSTQDFRGVDVVFLAAEDLLFRRYSRSKRFSLALQILRQSRAYQRTMEMERTGLHALRTGTYKSLL